MASISACMIVKNERRNLERTLPNLVAALDQVIVADTGSTDDSVAFAQLCGATVLSFDWKSDFAAARNFSLQHAVGDWILWPDADEWMSSQELLQLKSFLDTYSGQALGIPIAECADGTFEPDFRYYRAKLFRNRIGVCFDRPFNEQVTYNNRTLFPEQNSDIATITHWGSLFHLEPEDRQRKIKRNHDILEALIPQFPDDPGYLYSLAMTKLGCEPPQPEAAADLLETAHRHCPDSQFDQLILFKFGQILFRTGQHSRLDEWLVKILADQPDFVPFLSLHGTRAMMIGDYDSALASLNQAVQVMGSQTISEQIDPNEYGCIPFEKLGLAHLGKQNWADARVALTQALVLNPDGNAARFLKLLAEKESICQ